MSKFQNYSDQRSIVPPPCLAYIGDGQCTGCSACANACPQHAIEVRLNPQGFYRPSLRAGQCNECRLCLKRCPVIAAMTSPPHEQKAEEPEVVAAWTTDELVHRTSSSGGVFSELARLVLQQGGVVCGCAWGEQWTPRHVIVRDWADIARLRGSKYIPSRVGEGFYREVIEIAQSGTPVLFCGTPCQVAGLKLIAPPSAREHLLLVDLVCHGVPSLTSFWRYLEWKFGAREHVTDFSFRNKEISVQTIYALTDNGIKYLKAAGGDIWFRLAMVYHHFLQQACFNCRFGGCPRYGDLTLGDFWGIAEEWHHTLGDSVVLANTSKGRATLAMLISKQQISAKQSDYKSAPKKIGRLRGTLYPMPKLRLVAMHFLTKGWSFTWVYYFCYLPVRFIERLCGFVQRRYNRLLQSFSRLWN